MGAGECQESEEVCQTAPAAREQRADAGAQLAFSFLFSPGPQPWSRPHLS